MARNLHGKTAVVTGGTNGIGAAVALRLAAEGVRVAIVGRNERAAEKLMQAIGDASRFSFIKADIGSPADIEIAAGEALDRLSHIDILVNSAGGSRLLPFLKTDSAVLDEMLAVNLRGTFLFAKAAALSMIAHGSGGAIVNISSISGQRGSALRAAYGMAKSAVIQLTKVMAVELAGYAIRVNAIAPGPIETRAVRERHRPTTREAYLRTIPMQRYGTVDEVASAAVFLSSDEASYVTGHILNVDGGFYAAGLIEPDAKTDALPS